MFLGLRHYPEQLLENDRDAELGFSAERQSIWLRQDSLVRVPAPDERMTVKEFKAFYEGKLFYQKTTNVVVSGVFREWKNRGYLPTQHVTEGMRRNIHDTRDEVILPTGPVVYRGIVFNGVADGVVWIGIRDADSLTANFADASFDRKKRADVLQQEVNRITWRARATTKPEAWWQREHDDILDRKPIPISLGAELARTAIGALESGSPVCDVFADGTALAFPGKTAVIYGDTIDAGALDGACIELQRVSNVVFWTNLHSREVIERSNILDVPRPLENRTVDILGREHLPYFLSRFPWLWSKYFGAGRGFRVVRNDSAFLAALLLDEVNRSALLGADVPVYRSVAAVQLRGALRLRIRGRSGNGRSTALFQVARQAPATDIVVVLAPVMSEEDWHLLVELLESMLPPAFWFVVDDHDIALTTGGVASVDRLLQLLALPQWQERAREVSIVIAYASEQHGAVQAHPVLRKWPAIELVSDPDFVRHVVEAHFGPVPKGTMDIFLAEVSGLGSLRSIINHWRRYAHQNDTSSGPDVFEEWHAIGEEWRDLYKTLSGDALRALWSIAAFTERQKGSGRVPHEVLAAFYTAEDLGTPLGLATRLAVALHQLELDGWITATDDTYCLTLGASQSGLRDHPTYSAIVQAIAQWAARMTWPWDTASLGDVLMPGIEGAFFANDFAQAVVLAQRAVFQPGIVTGRELVMVLFLLWESRCCLGEQDAFLDDVLRMRRTRPDAKTVRAIVSRFWTRLTTADATALRDEWRCSQDDEKLRKLVYKFADVSEGKSNTAQLNAALRRRARVARNKSKP